jgi:hypothetical protein
MAFIIPIAAGQEPAIETVDDDAVDADDCSIYSLADGDDDYMQMIEDSLVCDCGNNIFAFNRCTQCGSPAPWASKLGCGLR